MTVQVLAPYLATDVFVCLLFSLDRRLVISFFLEQARREMLLASLRVRRLSKSEER